MVGYLRYTSMFNRLQARTVQRSLEHTSYCCRRGPSGHNKKTLFISSANFINRRPQIYTFHNFFGHWPRPAPTATWLYLCQESIFHSQFVCSAISSANLMANTKWVFAFFNWLLLTSKISENSIRIRISAGKSGPVWSIEGTIVWVFIKTSK